MEQEDEVMKVEVIEHPNPILKQESLNIKSTRGIN